MRLIICGGRDYGDRKTLFRVLDRLNVEEPITEIFHGAQTGADTLAKEWCESRGVTHVPHPADWDRYRNAAGPIRNGTMLKAAIAKGLRAVIAFPGDRGTRDMCEQATDADIPVVEIPHYH